MSVHSYLATALTQQLGIELPLVQAPMVGGITTPELVAAVSQRGGLGSIGAGYLDPEAIVEQVEAVRRLTRRPFSVNLFAPQPQTAPTQEAVNSVQQALQPCRDALQLPVSPLPEQCLPDFNQQLDAVCQLKVPVCSFTFGIPPTASLDALRQCGTTLIGTATHLLEGILLEESGFDFVVAQGIEAGGHRGTFIGHDEQGAIGTMVLTSILRQHLNCPIIAAGGIMNGSGIAAALSLGAVGVQMGTALLTAHESGASPSYKAAVLAGNETHTHLTRAINGRCGRALENPLTQALGHSAWLAPYPMQHALTLDVRRAAVVCDNSDYMALWAGQGCCLCREASVDDLITGWLEDLGVVGEAAAS